MTKPLFHISISLSLMRCMIIVLLSGIVILGIAGADDSITDSNDPEITADNYDPITVPKACKSCITGGECPRVCSKFAPPKEDPLPQDDDISSDDYYLPVDLADVKSGLSGYSTNEILSMAQKGLMGQNSAFRPVDPKPAMSGTGTETSSQPSTSRSSGCACGR